MIKLLLITGLALALGACATTPELPTYALTEDPMRVTIEQRKSKDIAGLSVRIKLGDITDDQVMVQVVGLDGATLVDTTSMKLHDSVDLSLGTQGFVVELMELHLVPAGADFAVFQLTAALPADPGMDDMDGILESDEGRAQEDETDVLNP